MFGAPLSLIPDITGDGKAELGVSVWSGVGNASAYVVGSEFFNTAAPGRTNISTIANDGAIFDQTPGGVRANLVSAMSSGSGIDLPVSDAGRSKLFLF